MGQPWTDVSDRRLLFLCEETGAGGYTSIGPRLWSLEPVRSFLWGNFCTPPTRCHRAKGLEVCISHPMDLICFLFGLGSWFCLILHFFSLLEFYDDYKYSFQNHNHAPSEPASPNSRRPRLSHTRSRS